MPRRRFRLSDTFLGFLAGQFIHNPIALSVVGVVIGAVIAVVFIK